MSMKTLSPVRLKGWILLVIGEVLVYMWMQELLSFLEEH